jgi:hypothetical protein
MILRMGLSQGGMTTPLPRNSFNVPLDLTFPAKTDGLTNYYDDGCLVGCDACKHHGAISGTDFGPDGPGTHPINIWAAPSNIQCTVDGKLVGRGIFNISLPGADTLPEYARTWNRDGNKINANPMIGDWGKFHPWRAPASHARFRASFILLRSQS